MQDMPITPQAEQTIQHAAVGTSPTTVWWAQPAATLLSATAVIIVAFFTFRHNRKKLEGEQREKRAKDMVQHLQGLYGDSITAAHQIVRCVARMGSLEATAEGIENGTIHMEHPDYAMAEIDRLVAERTRIREVVRDRLSEMATANARLLLVEGPYNRDYRLGHLIGLHEFLTSYSPSDARDEGTKGKVVKALTRVVQVIGASLQAQYYKEAGVPMPGCSMKVTRERIEKADRECRQAIISLPQAKAMLED